MVKARAQIVESSVVTGVAFLITECPEAPECVGIQFCAYAEHKRRIGDTVRVKLSPDDQYAYLDASDPVKIERCPVCGKPAHPSESDNLGRHAECQEA